MIDSKSPELYAPTTPQDEDNLRQPWMVYLHYFLDDLADLYKNFNALKKVKDRTRLIKR